MKSDVFQWLQLTVYLEVKRLLRPGLPISVPVGPENLWGRMFDVTGLPIDEKS